MLGYPNPMTVGWPEEFEAFVSGVFIGYFIIGSIIALGYIVERSGILGQDAGVMLNRFAFFVATPALLFSILARSDFESLFSVHFLVAVLSFAIAATLYVLIAALVFKKKPLELVLGALTAAQVNSNNIGVPVTIYMLGSAQFTAPVIMFQVVFLNPISLTILDLVSSGKFRAKNLIKPVTNPVIIMSILGTLAAVFAVEIPDIVMEPIDMMGGAAIPLILISFGMTLHGRRPLEAGSPRSEVLTASTIKLLLMPLIAWLLAQFVFGLEGLDLYAVVVMAALPSAQNVYSFAVQYNRSVVMTRDTTLITTVLSFAVLLGIALVLG